MKTSLIIAGLISMVAVHAEAAPITFQFAGQITSVYLGNQFAVGMPVGVTWTFDDTAVDSCADPVMGHYQTGPATIQVGGKTFTQPGTYLHVNTNFNACTSPLNGTELRFIGWPYAPTAFGPTIVWSAAWTSPTGQLPTTPPQQAFLYGVTILVFDESGRVIQSDGFDADLRPVPEPSTLILFVTAASALVLAHRLRTRVPA